MGCMMAQSLNYWSFFNAIIMYSYQWVLILVQQLMEELARFEVLSCAHAVCMQTRPAPHLYEGQYGTDTLGMLPKRIWLFL